MLTELERRVLHCVASPSQPVETAMECAERCGISMNEARRTLASLSRAGLIELVPDGPHDDDDLTAPARWEPTLTGRRELAGT